MTENKRFQWVYIKDNILELRDNGIVKVFNNERLEELLNELNDENEQLKQQVRQLSLIGEKQAKFIQSKGFDVKELIDFARDGSND